VNHFERDSNIAIALHAAWESHRVLAVGKESAPENLDGERIRTFLAAVAKHTGVQPPDFWSKSILSAHLYPGEHTTFNVERVRDGVEEVKIGGARIVAEPNAMGGFPYTVKCDGKWEAKVWAAGRTTLGGVGYHRVSMVPAGETLFIFGAESHGAYLEAFAINDGTSQFRFSTSYWFHFSEAWPY
jgi:hypothetical protein